MLQYNHVVERIRPITENEHRENKVRWNVSFRDVGSNTTIVDEFDAVVVCNGFVHVFYFPAFYLFPSASPRRK